MSMKNLERKQISQMHVSSTSARCMMGWVSTAKSICVLYADQVPLEANLPADLKGAYRERHHRLFAVILNSDCKLSRFSILNQNTGDVLI